MVVAFYQHMDNAFFFQLYEVPLGINPARLSACFIQHLETLSSISWIRTGQHAGDCGPLSSHNKTSTEGFQYKTTCFFWIGRNHSPRLPGALGHKGECFIREHELLCRYVLATRLKPNSDKCGDDIAQIGIRFAYKRPRTKTWKRPANLPRVRSLWIHPGCQPWVATKSRLSSSAVATLTGTNQRGAER